MNREHVLFHLHEAQESITAIVAQMEAQLGYDYGVFLPDMQHLYHHLNTAWNARDAAPAAVEAATDLDFNRWSQFPIDLPMMEV
ncbi:MAG: hypothetical protein NTU91_03250 [Chloroflexi bacterium]|nr:hypothetical protein [Chloroflexota bacterium]